MANLTLSIEEGLLRRARIRALEQDTSVNALVRDYLEGLVAEQTPRAAMARFLSLTDSIPAASGGNGRTWTRDELHER